MMMGNWQQIASLLVVALSAVLLVRSKIQKRKRGQSGSCGAECGCADSAVPPKKS